MPGAQCTRSLACKIKIAHERSHHGHTGNHPAFPAQWFYGFLRALPGDQACLTPSPALLLADLTPASGRQNHTTSPSAAARFVKRTARVHRIPPRVRDVRTPLCWDRTMRLSELICLGLKQKYFCKRGWTGHFGKHEVICPSGRISTTRLSVVPANAGTHTPRPHFLAKWLTASAPTNDGGYGSPLSRGRR